MNENKPKRGGMYTGGAWNIVREMRRQEAESQAWEEGSVRHLGHLSLVRAAKKSSQTCEIGLYF